MSAILGDMQRRIANMVLVGDVTAVDTANVRVKVSTNGLVSPWIPWSQSGGAAKEWNPPKIGQQVVMVCPSGLLESAVMVGSINSDKNPAPSGSGNQRIIELEAGGSYVIKIGAKTLTVNDSKLTFNGDIEVTGDVKAGSISLKTHVHGGVQAGGAQTQQPA
jgi:phage baseplate assembly protein V